MAGSLKFSVVLEAITQSFTKAINDARSNYSSATSGIQSDSSRLSSNTQALQESLRSVFQAKDADGITNALKSATTELNNTKQGAALTAEQLKLIGSAGKSSVNELTASLRAAQAEYKLLAASKASPTDLDAAKQKIETLKVAVADAQGSYARFQVAASSAMRRAATDTGAAAEQSKLAGRAIYDALNIKTGGQLRTEIATLTQQLQQFKSQSGIPAAEAERVTTAAKARLAELRSELRGVTPDAKSAATSLSDIGKSALAFAGVTAGFAAVKSGIEAVVGTTIRFEQVMRQLEFAVGGAANATKEFEFVKQAAKDLGLELFSTASGYAKLAASTRGTALEGEGTRKVFLGVASAAAALGLSAEDTNGVMLALSQMASKGKVSMEELRGQLGERLPGAMAIAAKSIGVTVPEMEALTQAGLDSTTFLKAFGPAMIEAFGPTAAGNVRTLQGGINALKNQVSEFLITLGKGGVGQAAAQVFGDMAKAVGGVQSALLSLDPKTVKAVTDAFRSMYGITAQLFSTIMTAVTDVMDLLDSLSNSVATSIQAFLGMDTASEKVGFLTRVLQGVTVILGIIQDGVAAIGIAFDLLTGVTQTFFAGLARALSKVTFGDLSKSMADLAVQLDKDASGAFDRAQVKAEGFKSAAVAALDRTAEAAAQAGAGIGAGIEAGASKAASAISKVGNAAQESFRKLEVAADNSQTTVQTAGGEFITVLTGASKVGSEVRDAFIGIGKDVGLSIPPAVKSVSDLGTVLGAVAAKSTALAESIGKAIPDALAGLNGPQIREFQQALVGGLEKAGASAQVMKQALVDIAAVGAKALGVDLQASLTGLSKTFTDNRAVLDGFIKDFDTLKASGVNANKLIADSLEAMLAKAKNPVELQNLITLFQQMGKEGKISGQQMADGIQQAKDKIDSLTPGINSLAEAFKTFGIQSREDAASTARTYAEAFTKISQSGKASSTELQQAFQAYAEAAVKANGGVVDATTWAKGAMVGLEATVDETGKVIVTAMEGGVIATENLGKETNNTKAAVDASNASLQLMYQRYADLATLSSDYNARQIADLEAANQLRQKAIDLENQRLNIDKQGFSLDKAGKDLNAGGATWLSILNTLKGFGVQDDTAARQIASQFTDSQGNVPYFNNPGQKRYQADTLSLAVLKAAQEYIMQHPNPTTGQSGSNTRSTTIKFTAPDGKVAAVATSGSSTVEDVMAVLRAAGATAITAG